MITKTKITFVLLTTLLLTACGVQHIPLNYQNRQSLKSIYINPDMSRPASMYVYASGAEVGAPFGLLGACLTAAVNDNAEKKMQTFTENNNFEIQKIVYNNWRRQFACSRNFKISNKPTDTELKTDILIYGITIPHGFSTDYVPILSVKARLVRNKVTLWQMGDNVYPLNIDGLPRYKMKEILADPKKLYAMWDKASERIINDMIVDLNK